MTSDKHTEILKEYQTSSYERRINERMMYYDYVFPVETIREYVKNINGIAYNIIIENIISREQSYAITPGDIFQFSSFEDCTLRLCELLKANNNPGVNPLEMGTILLNDGIVRKDSAYIKYGENHLKAAQALGLVWKSYNTYYLTCLGYIYDSLSDDERENLLLHLILRNKLVMRVLHAASRGEINMRQLCYMLSDSTYQRRRSNIKRVFNTLNNCEKYSFNKLLNNIRW